MYHGRAYLEATERAIRVSFANLPHRSKIEAHRRTPARAGAIAWACMRGSITCYAVHTVGAVQHIRVDQDYCRVYTRVVPWAACHPRLFFSRS